MWKGVANAEQSQRWKKERSVNKCVYYTNSPILSLHLPSFFHLSPEMRKKPFNFNVVFHVVFHVIWKACCKHVDTSQLTIRPIERAALWKVSLSFSSVLQVNLKNFKKTWRYDMNSERWTAYQPDQRVFLFSFFCFFVRFIFICHSFARQCKQNCMYCFIRRCSQNTVLSPTFTKRQTSGRSRRVFFTSFTLQIHHL